MRRLRAGLVLVCLTLSVRGVHAQDRQAGADPPMPDSEARLSLVLARNRPYSAPALQGWDTRLLELLAARRGLDAAAAALAEPFALTLDESRRLAGAWVDHWAVEHDRSLNGEQGVMTEAQRVALEDRAHDEIVALARPSQSPLLLASAIATDQRGCADSPLFATLAAGKPRAYAWQAIRQRPCPSWKLAFHRAHPDTVVGLWSIARGYPGEIGAPVRLALIEWLIERADHATSGRDGYLAGLEQIFVSTAFDSGLAAEGLARLDQMGRHAGTGAVAPLRIDDVSADEGSSLAPNLPLTAAAYLVAGDATNAARMLAEHEGRDLGRAAIDCRARPRGDDAAPCRAVDDGIRWQLVADLLDDSRADPFDLFASGEKTDAFDDSLLWLLLLQRRAAEPAYAGFRADLTWRADWRCDADCRALSAAVLALLPPPARERAAQLARRYERIAEPFLHRPLRTTRTVPGAVWHVERAMPSRAIEPGWLPYAGAVGTVDSYNVTRAERRGREVAALVVSWPFTGGGRRPSGGYWLWRSHDGGEAWDRPLYTGLQVNAPYEAVASPIPLVNGGRLTLAMRLRALAPSEYSFIRQPDIVLAEGPERIVEIDLRTLTRDGDGDGLTDILERRIGLNPGRADSDGDGLRDRDDPFPNVVQREASPRGQAMAAVLMSQFAVPAAAIPADTSPLIRQVLEESDAVDPWLAPQFLARLPPPIGAVTRMGAVLVYDDATADVPEFAHNRYGPLVLDRAGTRGFIRWDNGGAGGVLELTREGDHWVVSLGLLWEI